MSSTARPQASRLAPTVLKRWFTPTGGGPALATMGRCCHVNTRAIGCTLSGINDGVMMTQENRYLSCFALDIRYHVSLGSGMATVTCGSRTHQQCRSLEPQPSRPKRRFAKGARQNDHPTNIHPSRQL